MKIGESNIKISRNMLNLNIIELKSFITQKKQQDVLRYLLDRCKHNSRRDLKTILILGIGTGSEFSEISNIFTEANFLVTNKSENILNSFKKEYNAFKNFKSFLLDIFSGKSLFNFILKNYKFDLVIAFDVYNDAPNKKKRTYSARFIYKHFLKPQGIFCIVETRKDPKFGKSLLLKRVKPIVDITGANQFGENPMRFIIYMKD